MKLVTSPLQRLVLYLAGLILNLHSGLAHAHLGGGIDSIEADRKFLKGEIAQNSAQKKAAMTHAQYSVQEMVVDGVPVREYLSNSGVVFGIAWAGRHQVNFTPLLGSYRAEYETAFQAHRARYPLHHGLKSRSISSGNIQVEFGGHMGSMRGHAYVPSLMPPGVIASDIK